MKNVHKSTYFGIHARTAQFVLYDHYDDPEHAHDKRVVADPFPFFEQRFPPP